MSTEMMTSGEEILDLLFDKDDPLLADIDYCMSEDFNENLEQLQNSISQTNGHDIPDFFNSFLRDIDGEDITFNVGTHSYDLETDSVSHYTESSSPQSSSSSRENNETYINIDSVCVSSVRSPDSCIDSYPISPENHDVSPIQHVSESAIDIGADVTVFTSEISTTEDSSHSTVDMPSDIHIKPPIMHTLIGQRKRRKVDEDKVVIDTVPDILQLSEDEKKLIKKEGLHIPTHLPLTRAEEKELKRIRRKIRNKLSAQESRKRKKEYVDGLEMRVKICTSENLRLQKKVQTLETHQKSLLDQIKHLKAVIAGSTEKTVQNSTCLMVLIISFAFLIFPSLFPNPAQSKLLVPKENQMPPVGTGSARVLLSSAELNSNEEGESSVNKNQDEYVVENYQHSKPNYLNEPIQEKFQNLDDVGLFSSRSNLSINKNNLGNYNAYQSKEEKYVVPKVHNYVQEPIPDIFEAYEDVDMFPNKRPKVSESYEFKPGFQTNTAGSVLQNESTHIEVSDTGHYIRYISQNSDLKVE